MADDAQNIAARLKEHEAESYGAVPLTAIAEDVGNLGHEVSILYGEISKRI